MAPSEFPFNCNLCKSLRLRFADAQTGHIYVNLGTFEEALASPCSEHKSLVRQFWDYCRGTQAGGTAPIQEYDDFMYLQDTEASKGSIVKLGGCVWVLTDKFMTGCYDSWQLLLVRQAPSPIHLGAGRILDQNWVNVGVIQGWKDRCISLHGSRCENPLKIKPTQPDWLIDVQQRCIVRGHHENTPTAFVALSYRYGNRQGYKMDDDTILKLQSPGILDDPGMPFPLTPITREAMHLTCVLGERYLWIDELCIVHSNAEATARQLKLMAAIYASAAVTIVATDGDSQDGIQGLQGVSVPRDLHQRVLPFGADQLVTRESSISKLTEGTLYHNRAWTYQEFAMSPRRIIFNDRQLHWLCHCEAWHEESTLDAKVEEYIDDSGLANTKILLAGFPDTRALSKLICDYNKRHLSYDEDALPGISGLLSVLSRSFEGGFLHGLPEMFFDRWLGWGAVNVRRRTHSQYQKQQKQEQNGQDTLSTLPSWSWTGWQGSVYFSCDDSPRIMPSFHTIAETIPITKWYTSKSPAGDFKRRIRSHWYDERNAHKDHSRPLPAGWSRHDSIPLSTGNSNSSTQEAPLCPDGCGNHVFKHSNLAGQDDALNAWFYPFPVRDIQESTETFLPEQTPYLFCRTKGVQLWASEGLKENTMSLRATRDGLVIGTLDLHNHAQLDMFPQDTYGRAGPVELVAIYRSKVYTTIGRFRVREKYRLLWIEWKGGLAYRLGAASLDREEWEALKTEDVDLVLA
ncbi:hypothetical protein A1O1_07795 [Capronia coronata CBS 617.96]|uniref:Heterokaryon incompatibility domain-containing protein n=1 Tax=Capronia coronata CBS 617.96 TaxID=1182541 RepID=W9XWI7_9EURO|nr:uncharacterized protein A1O1_07795 [Capronia coronata CBS 617.96]EXJ81730.1 hypothetical protein A1O1_07795 [Capronia coronata CBS 617.96]